MATSTDANAGLRFAGSRGELCAEAARRTGLDDFGDTAFHEGLDLSETAERVMQDWLAANPRRSTTLQRFTPDGFGHSSTALLERYAAYRARYGYSAYRSYDHGIGRFTGSASTLIG